MHRFSMVDYIGDFYEISESAEKIYIGSKLSDEYTNSEARKIISKSFS